MKHIVKIVLAIAFCMTGLASTESGNTSFDFDAQFRMSTKHPEHDKLLKMIYEAELPSIFKKILIDDLSSTLVLYSSESLTYKDFLSEIRMQLVEKKKETRIVNGEITEILKERWVPIEESKNYGIYPNLDHKLKVDNAENAPLAAITTIYPLQVIYFTPVINSMSEAERFELILHEQAHRISNLFKNRNHDERFIRSWAQSLLMYLTKRITKSDFYKILEAVGLSTTKYDEYQNICDLSECFPNEVISENNKINSRIPILVNREVLLAYGVNENVFSVVLSKEIFKDYPPLYQNYGDYEIKIPFNGNKEYRKLKEYYDRIKTTNKSRLESLVVEYTKKIEKLNDASYVVKYEELELHNDYPEFLQLSTHVNKSTRNESYGIKLFHNVWEKPFSEFTKGDERVSYAIKVWDQIQLAYDKIDEKLKESLSYIGKQPVVFYSDSLDKERFSFELTKNKDSGQITVNLHHILSQSDFEEEWTLFLPKLNKGLKKMLINSLGESYSIETEGIGLFQEYLSESNEALNSYIKLLKRLRFAQNSFKDKEKAGLKFIKGCEVKNRIYSQIHVYGGDRFVLEICLPLAVMRSGKLLTSSLKVFQSPNNYWQTRSRKYVATYSYTYREKEKTVNFKKRTKRKYSEKSSYINSSKSYKYFIFSLKTSIENLGLSK